MNSNLILRLRDGFTCGQDACRIKSADSGCDCALAANTIELLERNVKEAYQRGFEDGKILILSYFIPSGED